MRTRSGATNLATAAPTASTTTATTSNERKRTRSSSSQQQHQQQLVDEHVENKDSDSDSGNKKKAKKGTKKNEEAAVDEVISTTLIDDEVVEVEAEGEGEEGPEDPFGVNTMTLKELKEQLKERSLSIHGTQKVLAKRLHDRLLKEQNPDYKPKPIGRTCKWCQSSMKKRRTRSGKEFYGCSSFPHCQYTTSLSGYAKPGREHLKGKYATFYNPNFNYERYY